MQLDAFGRMEVIQVPGDPHKFEVLFNGSQVECVNDTDCPGAGICAINQSWAVASGGWCICNAKYGFQGLHCNEWCGQAWMILFVNTFAALIGLILGVIAMYLFIRVVHRSRKLAAKRTSPRPDPNGPKPRRLNPIMLTLLLIGLGSLFFVAAAIVDNVATLGFPTNYVHLTLERDADDKHIIRTPQSLQYLNNACYAFAYCISVCSVLVLPLAWIDIAEQSRMMKKSQSTAVMIWSTVFIVIIVSIELPFYILAAEQFRHNAVQWSLAVIIAWAAIFAFIITLNLLAFFRVRQIRHMWKRDSDQPYLSAPENQTTQLQRMVRRIQIASIQIVVVSFGTVALMAFGHIRDQRTLYSDPRCYMDSAELAYGLSMFFVEYLCAVALWFVLPSALILAGMKKSRQAVEDKSWATARQQRNTKQPTKGNEQQQQVRETNGSGPREAGIEMNEVPLVDRSIMEVDGAQVAVV